MIVIAFAILGGLLGGFRARRLQGNRLDIAQYAAVHAIVAALLGVVVTIAVGRLFG